MNVRRYSTTLLGALLCAPLQTLLAQGNAEMISAAHPGRQKAKSAAGISSGVVFSANGRSWNARLSADSQTALRETTVTNPVTSQTGLGGTGPIRRDLSANMNFYAVLDPDCKMPLAPLCTTILSPNGGSLAFLRLSPHSFASNKNLGRKLAPKQHDARGTSLYL